MTEWVVVVPVKGTDLSKTRLADLPASAAFRRRLALAFALDTVEALRAAPEVVEILVVTNDPASAEALGELGASIASPASPVPLETHPLPLVSRVADPELGLNAAVAAGLAEARRRRPAAALAAITADLPSLTTHDVSEALLLAADHPASFVADLSGEGTTTITALPGVDLVPRFGVGSASAHTASGMHALSLSPGSTLRIDVDTPDDLDSHAASFGRHTRDLLANAGSSPDALK